MIRVSKKSWHYTLNNRYGRASDNLCTYFWGTVFKLLFQSFIISAVVFALLVAPVLGVIYGTVLQGFLFVITLALAVLFVSVVEGIVWLFTDGKYKLLYHSDNIAVEFIKAKKNKYCPRIEVVY